MSSSSASGGGMEEGEMSDDEQQRSSSFQVHSSDPSRPPRQVTLVRKGRGFATNQDEDKQERYAGKSGVFESLHTPHSSSAADYPVKSIGGYIVLVTNLHPSTTEDDLIDTFTDFGHLTAIHLNMDRRTAYAAGYALIEYAHEAEACRAVQEGTGMVMMERRVGVDWAFRRGSGGGGGGGEQGGMGGRDSGRVAGAGGGGGGGVRGARVRGVIRRDYRDLDRERNSERDRGRDSGRDGGRDQDKDRDRDRDRHRD